jgi:hypothetical protein
MAGEPSFAQRYLLAQLEDVQAALEQLDGQENPLAHSKERRRLTGIAARLVAALATYDPSERPALN